MADPFQRFRGASSPSSGREIQPRIPQQRSGAGVLGRPEPITLGPNFVELASLDHDYTPTTKPCLGTACQPWDSVAPAAGSIQATILLTRGLYVVSFFAQCTDGDTNVRRIDIDVQPKGAVFLNRANFFATRNGAGGSFEIWVAQPFPVTPTATGYPRLIATNIDAVGAGERAIGWIAATRKWTDYRDPGE